jgi:transposase
MKREAYPTDLIDEEWPWIVPLLPRIDRPGRPRKHPPREILNVLFNVVRTGCQWLVLPHGFPAWKTTYHYFRVWRKDGTWEQIYQALREQLQVAAGRIARIVAPAVRSGILLMLTRALLELAQRDICAGHLAGQIVLGQRVQLVGRLLILIAQPAVEALDVAVQLLVASQRLKCPTGDVSLLHVGREPDQCVDNLTTFLRHIM